MSAEARSRPVDVVLVDLPEVLNDIVVAALSRGAGVRIAALLRDAGSLPAALAGQMADVAIVAGSADVLAEPVRELLCRRPRLRVLRIGGDGREAVLYELRPHGTPLGEMSPASLLAAVTRPGHQGCSALPEESA
jgi:hypothetical protein